MRDDPSACFGTVEVDEGSLSSVLAHPCGEGSWSPQVWCRAHAGCNSWERWGTGLCHLSHTSFCHCSNGNEGALFYFWEGSALLQSWDFPREWGVNITPPSRDVPPSLSPWQPHTAGHRGCGCPLAEAAGQSSSAPVPHMHLSALHGQQESWRKSHTKRTLKSNPPSCHPNHCSHPDVPALKRLKLFLI